MYLELTGALKSIGNATQIVKEISNLKDYQTNSEYVRLISDLNLQIANLQMELASVLTQSTETEKEIESLKKELEKLKSPEWQLEFDPEYQAYYQKDDTNKTTPYCPNCWNNNKGKYILPKDLKKCICPNCQTRNTKLNGEITDNGVKTFNIS